MSFLSSKPPPNILKDDSFILSLEVIIPDNKKLTPIFYDKMTHLAYHFVTMNELMDMFYENKELIDVVCVCSRSPDQEGMPEL